MLPFDLLKNPKKKSKYGTSKDMTASSPEVGSSRNMTDGRCRISTAMLRRFFCSHTKANVKCQG